MSTTVEMLSRWFDEGSRQGATHMIVVCDQFDFEDFPVYVAPGEDPAAAVDREAGRELQRVMEVYCLSMEKAAQLREVRAFHLDGPATDPHG